jgi:glycosyltransferase involved in cell wall biosynthesis
MTTRKTKKHRILIVSHAHPDFSKGGAEITAYNLYKALKERDDCEVLFLARQGQQGLSHCGAQFGRTAQKDEILYTAHVDHFLFANTYPRSIWTGFREVLQRFRPTAVHFHHYTHLGLELIREVKNYSKDVPVFMTLHEYLAICDRDGQMLKSDGRLCWKSSPAECHLCRPRKSQADYFLRELYIKSFFERVDRFIAPSRFLLERYVAWGLPQEKLVFLENGQPATTPPPPRELLPDELRGRFAYFGQINPYKGVDILLEAVGKLPEIIKNRITVEIHGAALEYQPVEFQEKIQALLERERQCVRYYGPYEAHELSRYMARIDWVVVPSIWWENSPLIIQEAFNHKRPVICSNVGGMAEKVIDGKTGLHFQARNPFDLAGCLQKAAAAEGLWEHLVDKISVPLSILDTTIMQLEVYQSFLHISVEQEGREENSPMKQIKQGSVNRRKPKSMSGAFHL